MKRILAIVMVTVSIVLMTGSIGIVIDIIKSRSTSGSGAMNLSVAFYIAAAFGLIFGGTLMIFAVSLLKKNRKRRELQFSSLPSNQSLKGSGQ
jgi:hypothetical protein